MAPKLKRQPSQEHIAKHNDLKKLVDFHDIQYHRLDRPLIPDPEYDRIFNELMKLEIEFPELETFDSPTQRVGSPPLEAFEKKNHRLPMISLTNSYSPEDIFDFDKKIKKALGLTSDEIEYFCEPKLDGLAIELIYENGSLVAALTRGDGSVGELVTQNIRTIKSVPLRIDTNAAVVEVRGEVLMTKADFLTLNQNQEEQGLQVFANPRNAAAGTMRQLDSKIVAQRNLRFFAYAAGALQGIEFLSHQAMEAQFESWGLPVIPKFEGQDLRFLAKSSQGVVDHYHFLQKIRSKLPFEIDGLVVKVNSVFLQNDLGFIARSPRWATAAKYQPEQSETQVESIQVQVGRTGALTPVAVMKPVKVGGVVVTHATLHNFDELARKGVRAGDSVFIQRAGDVIPEIVSVNLDKRPIGSKEFEIPQKCPVCQSLVTKEDEESVHRCSNRLCPAQICEGLIHFASRRAMNIEKLGDRLIKQLYDEKLVTRFSDFYNLNKDKLLQLDRQGEKSAENIMTSIEKSKNTLFSRFIFALGIRFVGEQTAKALAEHFLTIEKLLAAEKEDFLKVQDVGPRVAQSLVDCLKDKSMKSEILTLVKTLKFQDFRRSADGKFSGLSFLVTGTLPVKRDHAHEIIESLGGKLVSGVSSKLSYLIVGEDPGSKVDKAEKLNVKILSWDDFQKLIGE